MAESPENSDSNKKLEDSEIAHEVIATGKRCAFGNMIETYLPRHVEYLKDPEVNRFIATRPPFSIEQQQAWLKDRIAAGDKIYALLAPNEEGKLVYVGTMGLTKFNNERTTAESGSFIGDKRYWGHGIAREARFLQLRIAFEDMGLESVSSVTIQPNLRSQRLLESTGYKLIETRPGARTIDGVTYDELLYKVTRASWQEALKKYLEKESASGS